MLFVTRPADFQRRFSAVGVVCLCGDSVLMLRREADRSYPERWGIPGGRVADGEDAERAAVREVLEETGLLPSRENLERVREYFVRSDSFDYDYTVFVWRLRARPTVTISKSEHSEFKWCTLEEALTLPLVPDQDAVMSDMADILTSSYQQELFSNTDRPSSRTVLSIESSVRALRLCEGARAVDLEWHAVIGPPAAGKSSLLNEIQRYRPGFLVSPDTLALIPNSMLNRLLHMAFFRGDDRAFFHFQIGILQERVRQILTTRSPALVDEGIYSTLAYSRALFRLGKLTADEYELFFRTYLLAEAVVGIPKSLLLIDAPVDVLLSRIRARGRLHEQMYTRSYVTHLAKASQQIARALRSQTPVFIYDTSSTSAADIAREFLDQCASCR